MWAAFTFYEHLQYARLLRALQVLSHQLSRDP